MEEEKVRRMSEEQQRLVKKRGEKGVWEQGEWRTRKREKKDEKVTERRREKK